MPTEGISVRETESVARHVDDCDFEGTRGEVSVLGDCVCIEGDGIIDNVDDSEEPERTT